MKIPGSRRQKSYNVNISHKTKLGFIDIFFKQNCIEFKKNNNINSNKELTVKHAILNLQVETSNDTGLF